MSRRGLKLKNYMLAPRALAVLSCALALLAVQPTGTVMVAKARSSVATPAQSALVNPHSELRSTAASPITIQRTARMPETLLASAGRLHILATVEILQRLLLAELQPNQQAFAQVFVFEAHSLSIFDAPPATALSQSPVLRFDMPPIEQQFAIEHCLLAPPLA